MVHPLGVGRIHREPFAAPIARAAQTLELVDDDIAVLVLKIPDALEELLTPQIVAGHALLLAHLALDPGLRRDARMVGARQPQHFLAILPCASGEDVLQRIIQDMPKMQNPSNIRRRNDDRIRVLLGPRIGFKAFSGNPSGVPLGFHRLGFIGFR